MRLVVKLNPAALIANDRATTLAVPGTGEFADSTALRTSPLAPGARLHQQFAHAVEALVLSVPWDQAAAAAAELARDPAVDAVEVDHARSVQ